jgi:hypothetical protein
MTLPKCHYLRGISAIREEYRSCFDVMFSDDESDMGDVGK